MPKLIGGARYCRIMVINHTLRSMDFDAASVSSFSCYVGVSDYLVFELLLASARLMSQVSVSNAVRRECINKHRRQTFNYCKLQSALNRHVIGNS